VAEFNENAIAKALEQEIKRCGEYGWSKITLHMTVPEAAKLAATLRRK
jgi:hypothetical protein